MKLQILRTSVCTPQQGRRPAEPGPTADRLRGRAAVGRRLEYLRLHPLCLVCRARGRIEAATVPDHVVPLWAGGADDLEANGQPLCEADHAAKTACEARMRAAGAWLSTACSCGLHETAGPDPENPTA